MFYVNVLLCGRVTAELLWRGSALFSICNKLVILHPIALKINYKIFGGKLCQMLLLLAMTIVRQVSVL